MQYTEYRLNGICIKASIADLDRKEKNLRLLMLMLPMNKTVQKSDDISRNLTSHEKACSHDVTNRRFSDIVSRISHRLAILFVNRKPGCKASGIFPEKARKWRKVHDSSQENPDSPVSESEGIIRELAEEHPTLFMT